MVADYLSSQLDWAGYQVSTTWGSGPTSTDSPTGPLLFPSPTSLQPSWSCPTTSFDQCAASRRILTRSCTGPKPLRVGTSLPGSSQTSSQLTFAAPSGTCPDPHSCRAFFAVLCWSIGWFGLLVFGYLFGIVAEQFADDVDDPPAVTDSPHAPQPTTPPQTPPAAY